MTQQQANEIKSRYERDISIEIGKMTMKWDDTLKNWHRNAIQTVQNFAPDTLGWPQQRWFELFEQSKEGVNMQVVLILCTAVKNTPKRFIDIGQKEYNDLLILNDLIVDRWVRETSEVRSSIAKRYQIMGNSPSFMTGKLAQA